MERTCSNTVSVEQLRGDLTRLPRERERERYTKGGCLTGRSRSHHAFYIILLDDFMGPTLGEKKKKKALRRPVPHPTSLSPPYDLPQLGPFYADLPGERMGTASGL